jgi:hypothetical protein
MTSPSLEHIVVIVFENKEYGAVLGSAQAPTFNRMAQRYGTLTHYYGVTHPSLPNYLALLSGSTHPTALSLQRRDQPLQPAADDRGRVGAPSPRPLGIGRSDHRHLAVKGINDRLEVGQSDDGGSCLGPRSTRPVDGRPLRARVTLLVGRLASWLGWDDVRLARLRLGAPLHDIGKVTLSLAVLSKSGPLAPNELGEIRTHPAAGAKLLNPSVRSDTRFPTCCTTTSAGAAAPIRWAAPARRSRKGRACSRSPTRSMRYVRAPVSTRIADAGGARGGRALCRHSV